MGRWKRIARWLAIVLVGLPVALVALVLIGGNTAPGQSALAWLVGRASGGMVEITALSGRFPDRLRVGRLALRDAGGDWFQADDIALDWWPLRFPRDGLDVERLEMGQAKVLRLPGGSESGAGGSAGTALRVRALHIGRFVYAPAPPAIAERSFAVDGQLQLAGTDATASLDARGSAGGTYRLNATRQGETVRADLTATEPPNGMLAQLAGAPDLGAMTGKIAVSGPPRELRATLSLHAGAMRADADGTIDAAGQGADLRFAVQTPSMAPVPQLGWSGMRLQGTVKGPFATPDINADLAIDAPKFGTASAQRLTGTVHGTAGRITTDLRLEVPRLPGISPETLTDAPLELHADLRLDAPGLPVTFTLAHPLLQLDGTASAEDATGEVKLRVARLAPLAAIAGVDAQGQTTLTLRADRADAALRLRAEGTLGLTAGPAPAPALLGGNARLSAAATLDKGTLAISEFRLDGAKAALTATGTASAGKLDLGWTLALTDLTSIAKPLRGHVAATGRLTGTADDATLDADLEGMIATADTAAGEPGRMTAKLRAEHLPRAPTASLAVQGALAGAPVHIDLTAARAPDGTARLDIGRAEWRSARAAGKLDLAQGAAWPTGTLEGGVTRLDDFSALLGTPLAGSVSLSVEGGAERVVLKAEARNPDIAGVGRAGRAWLNATVRDPAATPVIEGELGVDAASVSGVAGNLRLTLNGGLAALQARLTADLASLAGAPSRLESTATVDVPARAIALSSLTASWRGETARLLAPARIDLAEGVRMDRLRIGLRDAELDVAGSATPRLDLTGTVRNLPLDLIAAVAPGTAADGRLSAEARLGGTLAAPTGQVTLRVADARAREGIGRALPPVSLSGTVRLAGTTAQVDLRATAGRAANLAVTGRAPLGVSGSLDLRLSGTADLTLLDPVLTPSGRRARGRVELAASVGGSIAAPRLGGGARFVDGEVQDFTLGARIDGIAGRVTADGPNLRIEELRGRAGNGSLSLAGSIGVLDPALPVDLTLTARGARALAADRLSAVLDAALTLRGEAAGTMTAQGRIDIQQANIRVPERLPVSVATLNVRRPGARAEPAGDGAGEGTANILLDVAVSGRRLALSGRGINAEFGGTLNLRGSVAAPRPEGAFRLRRGTFNLAGRSLTFTKGEISFNGGALTDPSLDLAASSTSAAVTATIAVTGTAQKPEFKLSSVPELPQDEVLARLLFSREASKLSPVELAQIAATLASLSGAPSALASPLDSLRQGLGLDRLSVGSDATGNPNVNVGRYVAPGVYVGAKHGAGGAGATQGAVQIDLTDGLKLEGTFAPSAGTATTGPTPQSSGSGVGITYQFEY